VQHQDKNWIFANVSSIPSSRDPDEESRAKENLGAIDEIPFFTFQTCMYDYTGVGDSEARACGDLARGSTNTAAFGKNSSSFEPCWDSERG
jgi:hypothetical protein